MKKIIVKITAHVLSFLLVLSMTCTGHMSFETKVYADSDAGIKYSSDRGDSVWDGSNAQNWCRLVYKYVFSDEEKEYIGDCEDGDSLSSGDDLDQVFFLSRAETVKYLKGDGANGDPSAEPYNLDGETKLHDGTSVSQDNKAYWTRTRSGYSDTGYGSVYYVSDGGYLRADGQTNSGSVYARPAIWLEWTEDDPLRFKEKTAGGFTAPALDSGGKGSLELKAGSTLFVGETDTDVLETYGISALPLWKVAVVNTSTSSGGTTYSALLISEYLWSGDAAEAAALEEKENRLAALQDELAELIDKSDEFLSNPSPYDPDTISTLSDAVDTAEELLAQDLTTDDLDDLEAAASALESAIDGMKTRVEKLKEDIENLPVYDDPSDLTDEDKTAIDEAAEYYENLPEEYKSEITDEEKARLAKALLGKKISEAKTKEEKNYTAASWTPFSSELAAAIELYSSDPDLSESEYAEETSKLSTAMDALVPVPGGGSGDGSGGSSGDDPSAQTKSDAVLAVEDLIAAIPADPTTDEGRQATDKASQACDGLSDEDKNAVDPDLKKKLDDALAAIKSADEEAEKSETGEDGTALGKGASAEAAEAAILNMTSDNDLAGTKIFPLKLVSKKQTKNSISLSWDEPDEAVKYVIYGNRCNTAGVKRKMQRLTEVTSGKCTLKNLANGMKLKKGTYHKFMVVALDSNDRVVSSSKMLHVATKGGKYGNYKKVTASKPSKKKITLSTGKTYKIKAKAVGPKVKKHVGLRYESSDMSVATVTKNGKIKAVAGGSAWIAVYSQNGKIRLIKVKVN